MGRLEACFETLGDNSGSTFVGDRCMSSPAQERRSPTQDKQGWLPPSITGDPQRPPQRQDPPRGKGDQRSRPPLRPRGGRRN